MLENSYDFSRSVLGSSLDRLVQLVLDYDVAPSYLTFEERPAITHAHADCVRLIRAALAEHQPQQPMLRDALPWHLRDGDLATGLVEAATSIACYDVPTGVFDIPISRRRSRVFAALPDLLERTDDDGLLYCDGLATSDQALFHRGYAVQYHQLLRRHFTGHINDLLIGTLMNIAKSTGSILRLAIDDRRLIPANDFQPYMERDRWYGPPLTDTRLDDRNSIGCTVHANPNANDLLPYSRFFAYWRMDGERFKILQMEELIVGEPTSSCGYYILRYLHAIRDVKMRAFIHCDGAVRAYDSVSYAARSAESMPAHSPATRYRKLFRLDGRIPTDAWSNVVALWYRHNALAFEYLRQLGDCTADVVEP